jgi:predicted Holliday junction resolvase-like endonuclease
MKFFKFNFYRINKNRLLFLILVLVSILYNTNKKLNSIGYNLNYNKSNLKERWEKYLAKKNKIRELKNLSQESL